MLFLTLISFLIWIGLIFFHGKFWSKGPILSPVSEMVKAQKSKWPAVYVIVPARNEVETIREAISSLVYQDYPGHYQVLLVDDESTDGTGEIIQQFAKNLPEALCSRLQIIKVPPRQKGWSGKLWALSVGVDEIKKQSVEAGFFLFTDADIVHKHTHVTALVNKALDDDLDQVSEMVQLRCKTLVERALIPAFVFFFAMLYPFSKVNKRSSSVAAGAGGTVLIRQTALARIGSIQSLRHALIDDVTLANRVKRSGGKIYLGHSQLAASLRPYPLVRDVWDMIARTAYVQLHYSLMFLFVTIITMGLIWVLPAWQMVMMHGWVKGLSAVTFLISITSFLPTLSRFRLSPLWSLALPFIALFYLAATLGSAINHYRGRGVVWKGRAYTSSKEPVEEGKESPVSSNDSIRQGTYVYDK